MTPVHDVTIPLNFSSEVTEVPLGKDLSFLCSRQIKFAHQLVRFWSSVPYLVEDNIGGIISDEEARFINLNDDVEKDATAVGNPVDSTAVLSPSRHIQKYTHFFRPSSSFWGHGMSSVTTA